MKVGVFDSGIGGLSVTKSLLEHQLFEEIVYFGDTARVPYGTKDRNTIIRYALEAVEFFKNFDIDMIIVACNTVSAYALEEMREVATCPVIGVVDAGIKALSNTSVKKDANILILGTKATVSSKAYENGLANLGFLHVSSKATGLFVPLVEEGIYEGAILDEVFKYYFDNLKPQDAIILGCTHFPLLKDAMQRYFGQKVVFIHSGEAIVEELERTFDFACRYEKTNIRFFASENPENLKQTATAWLGKEYI